MSKKIDTSHVVKLEDNNWQRWKLQISLVLRASEVWTVVDGSEVRPAAADAALAWDLKDIKAQAVMVPLLDKKNTNHIYNYNTSREMWLKLESIHSDGSNLNKQHTLSRFFNYRISSDQSVVDAFSEVEDLARTLNEMGIQMEDQTVVTKIVSSLPDDKFHAFKKAWDSVPEASQTMPALLGRLRKEELEFKQQKEVKDAEPSHQKAAAFNATTKPSKNSSGKKGKVSIAEQKKTSKCHNCGKVGHWVRECKAPKKPNDGKPKQTGNDDDKSHAFMVHSPQYRMEETSNSDLWISDSGADQHISGKMDWFIDFEKFEIPKTVSLTKNEIVAIGVGTVQLEAMIDGEWGPCKLYNVLYIPGAANLFSEPVMAHKEYLIIRDKTKTTFSKGGKGGGPEAYYANGLYYMKFRSEERTSHAYSANSAKLWHDRLSHINNRFVRMTISKNAATGIKLEDIQKEISCEACHLGKETRKPFPSREKASKKTPEESTDGEEEPTPREEKTIKIKKAPGEFIHGDLSGKMPVASIGGAKYFLLLKDDATSFRALYFIQKKSETASCIKIFFSLIQKQTGNAVKTFRSDNGTEFVNNELGAYFEELGIVHQTTAAFCPESNGKIEREMRTLKDTARSMMCRANAPEFLWAEALACSVYVHNRVLNKQSTERTAYEQIYGNKPSLAHLRVFGSKAYAQVPKEKRLVWDPKSKPYTLVGYDSYTTKYRLYNPSNRSIVLARNVSFIEDEVPKGFLAEEKVESSVRRFVDDDSSESSDDEPPPPPSAQSDDDDEPPPPPSPKRKPTSAESDDDVEEEIFLQLDTGLGNFEAPIPPEGSKYTHKLRNRSSLKRPDRYQANHAKVIREPGSYKEALESDHKTEWLQAINEEYKSLIDNKTWKVVPRPMHAKVFDGRWVFKLKTNADGSIERFKARLVIKGYQQKYGVDYNETFASVCRYESVRLLFALAAAYKLAIKQFDIKTAFLNGELEEEIYMHQPEGFNNGEADEVCLLKKCLYGLKQAPRCWNKKFSDFLSAIGFTATINDPSVFMSIQSEDPIYLILYVDDGLVFSRNEKMLQKILQQIGQQFEIKITPLTQFLGIGVVYDQGSSTISLTQTKAIEDLLTKFRMQDCKPASIPMQPNLNLAIAEKSDEKLPYRELIGSLLFIARTTRPDIAYAVGKLGQFTSGYDESHWNCAKGILRYLKGTITSGIQYTPSKEFILSAYSDSDYAGDRIDRKSTTGFVFMVNNSPVSWCSKKQPVVAVSSTEAEYVALAAAAKEIVWARKFLAEIGFPQTATDIYVDNTSAIRLAHNPEFHQRSKHIDVRFHFTRSLIANDEIQVSYVPTTEQAADILTKPLLKTKHTDMFGKIGLKNAIIQRGNNAKKSVCFAPGTKAMLAFTMLSMMCILQPALATTLQNSQPVLWRGSNTPVTTGYERVFLRIKLMNPCELLTTDVLHADITKLAQVKCEEMYREHFLNEMARMCPVDHGYKLVRSKRFIPIILGAMLIASVVLWAGAGTAFGLAIHNKGRISDLKSIAEQQAEQIKEIEGRMNVRDEAVRKLQIDFNSLVSEFERHQTDFLELKGFQSLL
jgi:hypothetical protein